VERTGASCPRIAKQQVHTGSSSLPGQEEQKHVLTAKTAIWPPSIARNQEERNSRGLKVTGQAATHRQGVMKL